MHRFVLTTLLGTAILVANAGAQAADPTETRTVAANSFAALDRNGDHRISRSEAGFDRTLSQTFAEIDTDGDGFVSPAEFAAAEKTRTTVTDLTER